MIWRATLIVNRFSRELKGRFEISGTTIDLPEWLILLATSSHYCKTVQHRHHRTRPDKMKHGIKLRKLGRTSSHRQALLRQVSSSTSNAFPKPSLTNLISMIAFAVRRNLVAALLHHEQIQTTLPKAKEAVRVVEKVRALAQIQRTQSR